MTGLKPRIKIAFASGTDELNVQLIRHVSAIFPELPLYVVSEFPPDCPGAIWIRYRGGLAENLARCRHAFHGKSIRLAAVMLVPGVPFRRMRLLALLLSPLYFLAVNENLNDFMFRPRSIPAILRHVAWRTSNFLRWHARKEIPLEFRRSVAIAAGWFRVGPHQPQTNAHAIRPGLHPTTAEHLKFLTNTIFDPQAFRRSWRRAIESAPAELLGEAATIPLLFGPPDEPSVTECGVTFWGGKAPTGKARILIVSAYLPFPLSHGGAVRIHNLTQRAAADWDQALICFTESDDPPPPELLQIFAEVILMKREGSHRTPNTGRPEIVEQFDSNPFRAALRHVIRKWQPSVAQLEFTQMAQYAADCRPAKTILVEHDITLDLYQQLAQTDDDWDLHRELKRWRIFETAAWRNVDCVVAMSAKDQAMIHSGRAITLPNGVDLTRFHVCGNEPEPTRLLFIGSFSHLPNLLAIDAFLREVWPVILRREPNASLHIIAGQNHKYFLDYHSRQVQPHLNQPGVEIEGFVFDVRPAYARASVVIAPLIASAGTNLKILEALARGRPVVSTEAGVNGLNLTPGKDFLLAPVGPEMAEAILRLIASPEERRRIATSGRRRVETSYGWDEIARRQNELYRSLI